MIKTCLIAGVATVAGFSSTPVTLEPDVVVRADSQNCEGR
jgi:hypothetical protein